MKYFGTDGIRGIFGKTLFENIYKVGYAQGCSGKRILLATDTRCTGALLAKAFTAGAISGGASVAFAGVLPTPALAYALSAGFAQLGAVITASHNPAGYNGIKLFQEEGVKYSNLQLEQLELLMSQVQPPQFEYFEGALAPRTSLPAELYNGSMPVPDLNGVRLVVDCANGATAVTAPKAFAATGAEVKFINTEGVINHNCGVLCCENIINLVQQNNAHAGFVFDGDGDRVFAIAENGSLLDGDALLYILAKKLSDCGSLVRKKVVCTELSNGGLIKSLNSMGVDCIKTGVGDSLVAEAMQKHGLVLGAEPSGHVLCGGYGADGLRTALLLCELLSKGASADRQSIPKLSDYSAGLVLQPRVSISCPFVPDRLSHVIRIAEEWRSYLGDKGKILVRPSGTEPLLRISVEAASERLASEIAKDLKKAALHRTKNGGVTDC